MLADGLQRHSVALVERAALALTFPANRPDHVHALDQAIVGAREHLRLGRAAGLLSDGALRHHSRQLAELGRMVGGWKKRLPTQPRAPPV